MSDKSDKAFYTYIEKTLAHEGLYSDHPDDRGGPTKFGITQQVARENGYTGDMRNLTRTEAIRIYREKYWLKPGFDKINDINPSVAAVMLDIGVNAGPPVAVRFLQRALNALNRQGKDYPDMVVDGQAGPTTRACMSRYLAIRSREGAAVLRGMILAQLSVFYLGLAEKNPSDETFMHGWQVNRVLGNA
jgi:lysozyme family protein